MLKLINLIIKILNEVVIRELIKLIRKIDKNLILKKFDKNNLFEIFSYSRKYRNYNK